MNIVEAKPHRKNKVTRIWILGVYIRIYFNQKEISMNLNQEKVVLSTLNKMDSKIRQKALEVRKAQSGNYNDVARNLQVELDILRAKRAGYKQCHDDIRSTE